MTGVKLPKWLQALTSETGTRALYLPELEPLCKLIRQGMMRPYPGVTIRAEDVPVNGDVLSDLISDDVFQTHWTITVAREGEEAAQLQVVTKQWNVHYRQSPPVCPRNIAQAVIKVRG